MAKRFSSGAHRKWGPPDAPRPRSTAESVASVHEHAQKRRRPKRREPRERPRPEPYGTSAITLADIRETYRRLGQKHPLDEASGDPVLIDNALLERIVSEVDRLRRVGGSIGMRLEYVIEQLDPPLSPDERHAYKRQAGFVFARRRADRKQEEEALWAERFAELKKL